MGQHSVIIIMPFYCEKIIQIHTSNHTATLCSMCIGTMSAVLKFRTTGNNYTYVLYTSYYAFIRICYVAGLLHLGIHVFYIIIRYISTYNSKDRQGKLCLLTKQITARKATLH